MSSFLVERHSELRDFVTCNWIASGNLSRKQA